MAIRFAFLNILFTLALTMSFFLRAEDWSINVRNKPFDMFSGTYPSKIPPMKSAAKSWLLCAVYPHLKDEYWKGINHGMARRVKEIGVRLQVYAGGGYQDIAGQTESIYKCRDIGADAILIGAVAFNELDVVLEQVSQSTPIFALVNDLNPEHLTGRVGVSWFENESYLAAQIAKDARHQPGKLLWLESPGGSRHSYSGILKGIEGSLLEAFNIRQTDNHPEEHRIALTSHLVRHPDTEYIAGSASAAEVAASAKIRLEERKSDKIYASYINSAVAIWVKRGKIKLAMNTQYVLEGMLAIEMAVSHLEKRPFPVDIDASEGPLTQENFHKFRPEFSLAPLNFVATYSVNNNLTEDGAVIIQNATKSKASMLAETYSESLSTRKLPKQLYVYEWGRNVGERVGEKFQYEFLSKAAKDWLICVLHPSIHDSYWVSVNYGMSEHAKQLGISLMAFEAGGYNRLASQKEQLKECENLNPDAIIISSTSPTGLLSDIRKVSKNIPVFSLVNDIPWAGLTGKVGVSNREVGSLAAELVNQIANSVYSDNKVVWFGSPLGKGDSNYVLSGFESGLLNGNSKLISVNHAENDSEIQRSNVRAVLSKHKRIDFIVGAGSAIAIAISEVNKLGVSGRTALISDYFTPLIYRGILRKRILAGISDQMVGQGMLSIDQAVRHLEGLPYIKSMGPELLVVTNDNIDTLNTYYSMAPAGAHPVFQQGNRITNSADNSDTGKNISSGNSHVTSGEKK